MTCLVVCTPLVICGLRRFELSQILGILEWDYGHAPMIWDSRTHQIKPTLTLRSCAQHAPFHPPKICQLLPWELRLSFHQISMPNSHPEVCASPYTILLLTSPSWHLSIFLFEIPLKHVGISYPWKKEGKAKGQGWENQNPRQKYIYIWSIFLGPICLHSLILILK
jgi:hypothetical protein